jgi:HKD family nuclease
MITLQQLKEAIIQKETEWLREVHKDEAQIYANGMKDEINSCESVEDIVNFYTESGYDMFEAFENIIDTLMNSEFNSAK